MKTAREQLDILTTYQELGSYRAAAVAPGVVGNERAVVILSDGAWASGSGR